MKRFYVFLCLSLPLAACNLLKNTQSTSDKLHTSAAVKNQIQSLEQKDWLSQSGKYTFQEHTQAADYRIQLWPKGSFSYSPETGFVGQADSVKVSGTVKLGSSESSTTLSTERDQGSVKLNAQHQRKDILKSSATQRSSSPSWKIILPIVGVAILLVGYAIKKIRNVHLNPKS
jgi:hypothetical protein